MIHVLVEETGEYSDREWSVVRAFSDKTAAEQEAARLQALSNKYRAEYDAWCKKRAPHYATIIAQRERPLTSGVLTDEEDRRIRSFIGEPPSYPENEPLGDRFYVVSVPLQ